MDWQALIPWAGGATLLLGCAFALLYALWQVRDGVLETLERVDSTPRHDPTTAPLTAPQLEAELSAIRLRMQDLEEIVEARHRKLMGRMSRAEQLKDQELEEVEDEELADAAVRALGNANSPASGGGEGRRVRRKRTRGRPW